MKVLMINGSPNAKGCTFTALEEIGRALSEEAVEYEIFHIGNEPVRDCIGCMRCNGEKCVFDDIVNEFTEKAMCSDAFIFGSPVYFGHPTGSLLSLMNRAFFSKFNGRIYAPFAYKPAAAIVSARRAGTTASLDALQKYFTIAQMPVISSTYWNMVHGWKSSDVKKDLEGMQTMHNIGKNMAWILKCIDESRKNGVAIPEIETGNMTNFI